MRIYVAGPLTGNEGENVTKAMDIHNELMRMGHAPMCPHLSWFADRRHAEVYGEPIPYERWLDLDFIWIRQCEALFMIASSPGTDREVEFAQQLGIPVFKNLADVPMVHAAH